MASSSNNNFLIYNGDLFPSATPLIQADNRGFRYGDGLFETIRVMKGRIPLAGLHYERLVAGMDLLQLQPVFTSMDDFCEQMLRLCKRNGHADGGRVRVMVFRGGVSKPVGEQTKSGPGADASSTGYIIQSELLDPAVLLLNGEGWKVGVYTEGRKSCDLFSSLKSNNYLLSSMAGRQAAARGWDESLLLNSQGRVAEGGFTNIFYCLDGMLCTPPLSEGCVSGVMRRWILENAAPAGFAISERAVTVEELEQAEEIFLTNALRGIRWVGTCMGQLYRPKLSVAMQQWISANL